MLYCNMPMMLGVLTTMIIGLITLNFFIQPIGVLVIGMGVAIVSYQELNNKEPEEILRNFATALVEGNEQEARRLGSDEMDNMIETFLGALANSAENNPLEDLLDQVTSIDCEEDEAGSAAVCAVCVGPDCQDIRLIQENRTWVVDVSKE